MSVLAIGLTASDLEPLEGRVKTLEDAPPPDLSGYVPTARTINGKPLTSNVTLSASDVGAAASSHTHSDLVPTARKVNNKALTADITLSAADVGAVGNGGYSGDLAELAATGLFRLATGVSGVIGGAAGNGDHVLHGNWDGNAAIQFYMSYNKPECWGFRNKAGGTWREWVKLYHTGNKPTAADVGAAAASHSHSEYMTASQVTAAVESALAAIEAKRYPVGHVLVSFNTANPATLGYPGTWVQLDADSGLISSASPSTTATGTNTPTVPVPAHDHGVWINEANTDHRHAVIGDTWDAGAHTHSYIYQAKIGGKLYFDYDGTDADVRQVDGVTAEAGAHTHHMDFWSQGMDTNQSHTHTGGTAKVGTEGATLDVRGKRYAVTMWRRSA